jgi:hypothetical protein
VHNFFKLLFFQLIMPKINLENDFPNSSNFLCEFCGKNFKDDVIKLALHIRRSHDWYTAPDFFKKI